MKQEELMQFVQWLPSKVEEFQNKTPEEIVGKLNELAQTEDGMNTISGLINQFKQEQSAGMFKQGGKLAYLVNKFKDGGSAKNERKENKKVVKEGKKSSKFNRTAYRNMKSAIKDQDLGLSRREVKAAAMKNIVGDNSKPKVTKTEGSIVSQPLSFGVSMKTGITPKVNVQTNVTPDLSQGNFNQAFAAARSAGLTSFTWNGKLYGTQLAPTRPAPKKPKLPQSNLGSRNISGAEEAGMSAAKGIRPTNMNEELVITNPSYSDYIVASNLGNPNRFDSRYVGPRSMSVNYGNNATLGSIPVEHRINPRNLGSFFQEGGKTTTKVKVNPNDSVAVTKALNNRTGDHNVHDVFNTTGLVRDSLIKIGYNPVMVNRIANPIISNAERKLDEFSPEQYTPRQQNLLKFLHPTGIPYWANGTADTEQAKSNGYKSERIINSDGSIREIVTNPKGKRSYRDISADKRDTTYTNDLSSMSRSNNPKWWKFRDKKVERQEYDKRDKAFNKRFNLK